MLINGKVHLSQNLQKLQFLIESTMSNVDASFDGYL